MADITEYGEITLNAYLDEWGRRRINSLLEDGVKVIVTITAVLKQWSQTGFITHVYKRHKTFRLTQALKTLHQWTLPIPTTLKKWIQVGVTTHVFRRPFRLLRLTQTARLTHMFRRNKLIRYITQILHPLHNWIRRVLGGFPFKIVVEERQPVNVMVEPCETVQVMVEERKPVKIEVEERVNG